MHSRIKVGTVRALVMMTVLAVWAATGSAAKIADVVTLTVRTSRPETIIFAFKKYASVSDKVNGGIHTVTLSTGCFSAAGFARSMMLFKIDYWLKTHRKGQTRTSPAPLSLASLPQVPETQVESSPSLPAAPVSPARIKHH